MLGKAQRWGWRCRRAWCVIADPASRHTTSDDKAAGITTASQFRLSASRFHHADTEVGAREMLSTLGPSRADVGRGGRYTWALERREVWSASRHHTMGVTVRDDPTFRLGRALADQRAVTHQAVALGVFLTGCAMWRFTPLHEPEPFTGMVIAVGGLVLGVVVMLGWSKHEETTACVDDVILSGFLTMIQDTPVQRAVSHRLTSIETPRSRRRLAGDLRWRLKLADGTARPSPGYMRASVLPPLGASERRVLLDERQLVLSMIVRLEQAPMHPQALVILRRIVTTPPRLDCEGDRLAGEELRRRLHAASVLVANDDARPAVDRAARTDLAAR